ncbi:hypothetical protein BURKHO8Y_240264 [Burkholderia sp. 8Y]|nr:hypothetical protein BURKHO8Y_240264 [Burkholderia sp. 8Y]
MPSIYPRTAARGNRPFGQLPKSFADCYARLALTDENRSCDAPNDARDKMPHMRVLSTNSFSLSPINR